ncbi:hypothetical protein CYMTET_15799, partial [Cymbomonas tetramitiformis]
VVSLGASYAGIGYTLQFEVPGTRAVDWAKSSRLKTGSLLCLTPDGTFDPCSLVLAIVLRGVAADASRVSGPPTITISVDVDSTARFDPRQPYVMLESPVFFEAFRHVLQTLQGMSHCDLPFAPLLTGSSRKLSPPSYVMTAPQRTFGERGGFYPMAFVSASAGGDHGWDLSAVFPAFERATGSAFWDPRCQSAARPDLPAFSSTLDDSQRRAIALALSKGVSLIQGPPGTGKTYVGVLITQLLLANAHLRARKPILFVCQTNHALDQILERVYEHEKSIIRVGGRSSSPVMQGLTLQRVRQRLDRESGLPKARCMPEEYQAFDDQKVAIAGLRGALMQRSTPATDGTMPVIDNAALARLCTLLSAASSDFLFGRNPVEAIIEGSANTNQQIAWKAACEGAKDVASKGGRSNKLPQWVEDFDRWMSLAPRTRALMLATYVGKGPEQMVDGWLARGRTKPKRARKQRAGDGWQVVGAWDVDELDAAEGARGGQGSDEEPSAVMFEEDAGGEAESRDLGDDDFSDLVDSYLEDYTLARRCKRR